MIKKILKYLTFFFYGYWQVPKGLYCYTYRKNKQGFEQIKICPYWDKIDSLPEQNSGYCHWLEQGDIDINNDENYVLKNIKTGDETLAKDIGFPVSLLWDQCKECGVKINDSNFD